MSGGFSQGTLDWIFAITKLSDHSDKGALICPRTGVGILGGLDHPHHAGPSNSSLHFRILKSADGRKKGYAVRNPLDLLGKAVAGTFPVPF